MNHAEIGEALKPRPGERLASPLVEHERWRFLIESQKYAGKALAPADGYVRNPLLELPRNMACPCKSGRKWKACCMPLTHRYIPEGVLGAYEEAKYYAEQGDWVW